MLSYYYITFFKGWNIDAKMLNKNSVSLKTLYENINADLKCKKDCISLKLKVSKSIISKTLINHESIKKPQQRRTKQEAI